MIGDQQTACVLVTGSSGRVGWAVAAAVAGAGWVVRGCDRMPGPRTTVLGDLRDPVVLRTGRCFPEPLPVLARHRLHRGVALADVAHAHLLALGQPQVTGTFHITGPLLFEPEDCASLYHEAAHVIRRRAPAAAAAVTAMGWPLPGRIDRVYDSRAADAALGYQPAEDITALLSPHLPGPINLGQ